MVDDLLLEYAPDLVIYGGWGFGGFSRAKNTYGYCDYKRRAIVLSEEFALHAPHDAIVQTILHEIAHALTPGDSHGSLWLATARRIGYTGERTSDVTLPSHSNPLWVGACGKGCEIGYQRKPGWKMLGYGICKKHKSNLTWTNTRTKEIANA